MGADQRVSIAHQRWNPDLDKMEDWWPGKCCKRTTFHTYHQCTNFEADRATSPFKTESKWESYQGYQPDPKPFEGFDRKKWPHTFQCLILFYYGGGWYQMTKSIYKPYWEKKA